MEIIVQRGTSSAKSTIGEMSIDGDYFCFTLEDVVRPPGVKVQDQTAIPPSRYRVTIEHSPAFKRDMPRLHGVEGFTGILIHNGNTADHTSGCILVGATRSKDFIGNSVATFNALFALIQARVAIGEEIYITVLNPA
jgi:hypothetical protein